MKAKYPYFLFIISLFSINTVFAQYGNSPYGGGYGGGGYGSNGYSRNGGANQIGQGSNDDKPKEIPVEETVGKIMEQIKPELNLDALQEIAVANVLTESIRAQGIILKDKSSQEQKLEEIKALSETTDRKINEFLDEDQKVKYKELKENTKNKKGKKNKKTK